MESGLYADGGYLLKNPGWHEQDAPWKARHIQRMLDRNRLQPRSVIDVGSGSGDILSLLSRTLPADAVMTGYEVSPQAHGLSISKQTDRLTFRLEDAFGVETPRADLAMAIDVIEHIPDCYGFASKLREKAEYKLYHIPLDLSASSVFRTRPLGFVRARYGHIHFFTRATAIAMLRDTGHDVIDAFYTATALEVAEHGWRARLMAFPRKSLKLLGTDFAARTLGGFSLMVLAK